MTATLQPLQPPDSVQTILEALTFWAGQTPNAVALLAPGREPATYRELYEAARRLACELHARGFNREDEITLLLPEGPELCVMLLATIAAGIAVPLAWPSSEMEYQRILSYRPIRAAVVYRRPESSELSFASAGLPLITLHAGASGHIRDLRVEGQSIGDPTPQESPAAEDIAVILHSSGTTGRPKLVPRLHRSIISTCRTYTEARGITSADRCLSTARITYGQGINSLMVAIFAGATFISIPGLDLTAMPRWLRDFRPTFLSSSPAVLRHLTEDQGELRDALRRTPVRCIYSGAGPLLTHELSDLESTLGTRILNGYSMTEASGIAGECHTADRRVPGAVGRPWCEIRIVEADGEAVAPGETGEITVRGPRVFPGYLDDPEANATAFLPGGWFRTGDVGFVDEAGYLHLTGRLGDTINRGGEKIAPVEIDHALLSHPAIAEAAVFAVPDALLGEDLVAAVVLNPGMQVERKSLHKWLLDRIALFKIPRRIWVVEELPRTATGKLRRGELARQWSEDHR